MTELTKVTAIAEIELTVKCPKCNEEIDLYNDTEDVNKDGVYFDLFREWTYGNNTRLEDGTFEEYCRKCGAKFVITKIQR